MRFPKPAVALRSERLMAQALELFRSVPRYLTARAVGGHGARPAVGPARAAPVS